MGTNGTTSGTGGTNGTDSSTGTASTSSSIGPSGTTGGSGAGVNGMSRRLMERLCAFVRAVHKNAAQCSEQHGSLVIHSCHFLLSLRNNRTGTRNLVSKAIILGSGTIGTYLFSARRQGENTETVISPIALYRSQNSFFSPSSSSPFPYTRRRERTPDFLVIRSPDESIEICVGQKGRTQKGARSAAERHSVCSFTAKLYRRVLGFVGMDGYRIIRRTFDRKREK